MFPKSDHFQLFFTLPESYTVEMVKLHHHCLQSVIGSLGKSNTLYRHFQIAFLARNAANFTYVSHRYKDLSYLHITYSSSMPATVHIHM